MKTNTECTPGTNGLKDRGIALQNTQKFWNVNQKVMIKMQLMEIHQNNNVKKKGV